MPPRAAWDCVHHFCATVLPFRVPEDVRRWSERHNIGMGPVVSIDQVTDLGSAWDARHADPDWRKWTAREAARIFREVGLTAEFWHVPDSEGSF